MCGIAGLVSPLASGALIAVAEQMADRLVHRGPDGAGVWAADGVVLAHRRLSIIDVSHAGAQPMTSRSGRYVLTYNGELYNTASLRSALGQVNWRGHSDTEVLLEAIEQWGVPQALKRMHGMFAFGVWDNARAELTLSRDRVGEKPLYYGRIGRGLAFASELKALRVVPGWSGAIDSVAVALFMQHSYVPPPRTIYKDIKKLYPGHYVTLSLERPNATSTPYWSFANTISQSRQKPVRRLADATDELEGLLRDSIRRQCISDVPIGAFLSGGIDSSTIVALMQAELSTRVRTFTIGFTERIADESGYARDVAKHLGTEHTELIVTPAEAMAVIPELPRIYDEPFADSSQIPTTLVSRLARKSVAVSLSGDAGDELFGGYNRYRMAEQLANIASLLPLRARRATADVVTRISPTRWQQLYDVGAPLLPPSLRNWPFGDRIHKLMTVLSVDSVEDIYRRVISHWSPQEVCLGDSESLDLPACDELGLGPTEWMMRADFVSYLPNDILVKVDRAAMSASLETRIPMLDLPIIEFAWRMPIEFKMHNGVTKRVLREVLARHVPTSLFERPKTGFGIPLDSWLRGPLREWANDLLAPSNIRETGLLNVETVSKRWREHLSGRRNWQYHIWDVLMLQAWVREQRSASITMDDEAAAQVGARA